MASSLIQTPDSHPSDKLPAEKKAELFRVALSEFGEEGYKGASLNRIIAGVGMSKSSFYHYFHNKADLFERTIEHCLGPLVEEMELFDFDAVDADSFWPSLHAAVHQQTLAASRSTEFQAIWKTISRAMDDPAEQELTQRIIGTYTQWLHQAIERGQELGIIRTDLRQDFWVAIMMGLSMAFDRWVLENWEDMSEDELSGLADFTVDIYQRVLSPA